MAERSQAQIKTARRAGILLFALLVTRFAAVVTVDRGWIHDPAIAAALGWIAFVLGVSAVVLLFVIIRGWDSTTRYGPRIKVAFSIYLILLLAGGLARRSGLVDWLIAQGTVVERFVYATSSLVPVALVVWMMVLTIKDLEERTKRDVEAKLHDHAEEVGQAGAIGHLPH